MHLNGSLLYCSESVPVSSNDLLSSQECVISNANREIECLNFSLLLPEIFHAFKIFPHIEAICFRRDGRKGVCQSELCHEAGRGFNNTACELLSQMSINYLSKVGPHAKGMKIWNRIQGTDSNINIF
jgi:hypothetical protein